MSKDKQNKGDVVITGDLVEKKTRALIVEDSEDDALLLVQELQRQGHPIDFERVDTSSDMEAALEKQAWDIVLSDSQMPRFSATEALSVLKATNLDIPFIVISGTIDEEQAVALMKSGAHDYLMKDNLQRFGEAFKREIQEAELRKERQQFEQALSHRTNELLQRVKELQCMYEVSKAAMEYQSLDELFDKAVEILISGLQYPHYASARIRFAGQDYSKESYEKNPSLISEDIIVGGKPYGTLEVCYLDQNVSLRDEPFLMEEKQLINGIATVMSQAVERQNAEKQFLQSQRLEAVGRLAGGVAHDFNNLLTIIIGNTEIVEESINENDPLMSNVEQVFQASESATALTRQLLAFSRKQMLKLVVLDVNKIITNIGGMLGRLIGEDVILNTSLAKGLENTMADPGQIEQVVMNLAINARDAMPKGGKLTIGTSNVEFDEQNLYSDLSLDKGKYVMISVTDDGVGMDEKTVGSVFEPFFTTKEIGKGTGLGLSTVYGIVKQSSGDIRISSEVGAGTTFELYFPVVDRAEEGLELRKTRRLSYAGIETVLVVEDDIGVRDLAEKVMTTNGYKVVTASNGEEGLRLCQESPGKFQLLLTDVVMPGMSGVQLAEKAVQINSDMKIVFMSGYTGDAILNHGIMGEEVHFLPKPFTVSELTTIIREILDEND